MGHFVHAMGLCESVSIGEGTRIWAFAHVLPGAVIGRDCNICDHVFIENEVVLGDRVTVKCGVQLWDGLTVEDDVFIGPNATFSNDHFPRSKQHDGPRDTIVIRAGASVGAGATVLPGVTIGRNAMVGAGAVVTGDVQPNAVVTGNPARVVGYVDTTEQRVSKRVIRSTDIEALSTAVRGVEVHRLKLVEDMRGNLAVGEFCGDVPFVPMRFFTIFDVPGSRVRGEHALRNCAQFLICLQGQCSIVVDDGSSREEILLDAPHVGVFLPPLTWSVFYKFSPDSMLLVFASTPYKDTDYIRDYQAFVAALGERDKCQS